MWNIITSCGLESAYWSVLRLTDRAPFVLTTRKRMHAKAHNAFRIGVDYGYDRAIDGRGRA